MKQILAAYFQLKVSFLIHLLSKTNLFFSRFPFGISFQITFIKSTVTSEVTSVVIQSIMNKQSEANNKVKVQNLIKIFSENEVKTCSVQEEKEKEEDQC